MRLRDMIKRQVRPIKEEPLTEKQLKEREEEHKNDLIRKSSQLKKLIRKDNSGWTLFCDLIQDYKVCRLYEKTKLRVRIPVEKDILEKIDREIETLNFVMSVPEDFINRTEAMIKKGNEHAKDRDD